MLGLRPMFEKAVNAQMKSEEGHQQMFADMDIGTCCCCAPAERPVLFIDSDGQVSKKELRKWLHEQKKQMSTQITGAAGGELFISAARHNREQEIALQNDLEHVQVKLDACSGARSSE